MSHEDIDPNDGRYNASRSMPHAHETQKTHQDLPANVNMADDTIPISNFTDQGQPQSTAIGQDSGTTLLYPTVGNNFPMKTSDRLIDDILSTVSYIRSSSNSQELIDRAYQGILKMSPLSYSEERQDMHTYVLGNFVDQVALQTKYEYNSISCPELNKINVYFGLLMDPNYNPNSSEDIADLEVDDILKIPFYHVKLSIKTRSYLESRRKQVGVTHYHLIDKLHPFDKLDFENFNPNDPNLADYAIFVSNDTNKLVLIEIFNSEFNTEEEVTSFKADFVKERYLKACEDMENLEPKNIPSPADCFNTLFKVFKAPLNRKSASEPIRTIDKANVSLNSHMNPDWLVTKYGFSSSRETNREMQEETLEFEPPDLTNYVNNFEVRKLRESYIKKCLELAFRGQLSLQILKEKDIAVNSKTNKFLNSLHTQTSTSFLFQAFGESHRSRFLNDDSQSSFDVNFHFINLSACYYYSDRDMIRNYETLILIDPDNIGTYFDALSFIANIKGAYQIIAYCGKQNVVGKEALENALRYFKIDPENGDVQELDDTVLLSIYKQESQNADQSYSTDLKNSMRVLAKYKQSDKLIFYVNHEPYRVLSQAYITLEIDESVDDDIIQTAYTIKINDSPGLKIDCDRALFTIAIHKRSMSLFNFLMQECPEFFDFYGPDKYSYQEALTLLQVNENANDELVLAIFQRKWNEESVIESDHFLNLKAALAKIGNERNSKLIQHFLETGMIDPNCLPLENWPTGLNNIGNTCYLNSLLQYYFSIAPLKDYVLNYQTTFQDFENNKSSLNVERRIGGREVSDNEVERSIQFMYQLRDLFQNMIYSNSRCVTPSQELAYLAFAPSNIEVEFESTTSKKILEPVDSEMTDISNNTNEFVSLDGCNEVLNNGSTEVNTEANTEADLIETQDSDVDMLKSEKPDNLDEISSSSKVAKISSDQLENTLEMGRQQDVTECIGNVLYQLESASEPISIEEDHEQHDLVKQLFYGKTKQEIVPLNDSNRVRTKYEGFLSLLVNVSDHPKDIYDALDSSFQDEILQMEEYGDVKRTVCITSLPTILQIQIQRVYYDRERFMPFKSIEPVPFNETIYMDRYVSSDNEQMKLKKEDTFQMKVRLRKLREKQHELLNRNELGLSKKESFIETRKLLQSDVLSSQNIVVPGNIYLINQLNGLIDDIDKELSEIYNEIVSIEHKIDHQFDEFKEIGYSLFAVFIHRGQASYGHYWIYIKDRKQNNIWRKYNDETVTEVQEDEVFNFNPGNTATPYFLVFVKNEEMDSIEPLNRIIGHEPLVELLD